MRKRPAAAAICLMVAGLAQSQEASPFKSAYDAAEALRAAGKFQDAIDPYRRAWNLAANETQSARATYRIGEMYANLGETKAAMEWMKKSLAYHRYEVVEEALRKLQLSEWETVRPAADITEALITGAGKGPQVEDGVEASTDLEVLFDLDKDVLKPGGRTQLDELGKSLVSAPLADARIRIVGHTDRTGTPEHNQDLSERRARSVSQYLIANFQVSPARLEVKGMGMRQLRYMDHTAEADRLNRRVEVQLLK